MTVANVYPVSEGHDDGSLTEPHNPFATRFIRPGQIPFFFEPGESIAVLHAGWLKANRSGQIVGPHGTGKSTLMMEWERFLAEQAMPVQRVTITTARPLPTHQSMIDWRTVGPSTVLMIDGYEQCSAVRRWRIERSTRARGAGLLITSHRDMNLAWTYRTDCHLERVQAIVRWLQRQCEPQIGVQDVADVYAACGGSSRELLLSLFDIYRDRIVLGRAVGPDGPPNERAANQP